MKKHICILLFISVFAINTVQSQVTISPTFIYLDKNSKVGSFFVSNPGNNAVEVQLSFEFAYPTTDENGRVEMKYTGFESENRFALDPYLRAFPTTFSLQPGQRQTVRLIGRIPQDSEAGTYWTRMRISSNSLTPPIGEVDEGALSARVSFNIEQITAVFAHHKEAESGLTIHEVSHNIEDGILKILTDVERTGNSPFIGSVETTLFDENNNEIDSKRSTTTVYYRNNQLVELSLDEIPSGNYRIEIEFESQRNDISSQDLLQISPVSERIDISIP